MTSVCEWLVHSSRKEEDRFDRYVFACAIAAGLERFPLQRKREWCLSGQKYETRSVSTAVENASGDPARALSEALGLAPEDLSALMCRYFPKARFLPGALPANDIVPAALEEDDLKALLLDHATSGNAEQRWLAAIIARRSLERNHLWEALGLDARADLNRLMRRHFAPLFAKNPGVMRWKKFFYRQLCEAEGLSVCKSPQCSECPDHGECFTVPAAAE